MGIRGLLKYIRSNDSRVRLHSIALSTETKHRYGGKAVLICDLIAIFLWLIETLHTAKVKSKCYSQYTSIYGGDYNDFRKRVIEFVEALRSIEVEPIFFQDGPRGSSDGWKQETWKERFKSILQQMEHHKGICSYDPATEVKFEKRIKKTLLLNELVQALRNANVEVIVCVGEADSCMAQYMRDQPEVCGILTNDTDMALMSGCAMIHYKLFDRKEKLGLHTADTITLKPHEIFCEVMHPYDIAKSLEIDEKCLPALSILCGNDFTAFFNKSLDIQKKLHFSYPYVQSVSVWIKKYEEECKSSKSFQSIREIQKICEENPHYRNAICYTYDFYHSAYNPAPTFQPVSPFYELVISEVQNHRLDHIFMSVATSGTFWREEIHQICDTLPCIHEKLLPFRKMLYMLLHVPRVTEYGQSKMDFKEVNVQVSGIPPVLPPVPLLHKLRSNQCKAVIVVNALLKGRIDELDVDICDRPLEIGAVLTCSGILYSLQHRLVPKEYIDPLILACFCCALGHIPPKIAARPGPIGVTIASQFMVILQHARWLASLLGLENQLPLPSTVFQPFVYIPLHLTAFKLNSEKSKFHREDEKAREFYELLSTNKEFVDFKRCICSGSAADNFGTVVIQYLKTKEILSTLRFVSF